MNDIFMYEDYSYSISAIQNPDRFFNINKLGIKPQAPHSACWRGYVATFSIYENKLVLKDLDTNVEDENTHPVSINGTVPIKYNTSDNIEDYWDWRYREINMPMNYSGNILITEGFIRERYIHMGFQSPLSYSKVIELSFDKGKYVSSKDISEIIARLRDSIEVETYEDRKDRLPIWIDERFSLKYSAQFKDGKIPDY